MHLVIGLWLAGLQKPVTPFMTVDRFIRFIPVHQKGQICAISTFSENQPSGMNFFDRKGKFVKRMGLPNANVIGCDSQGQVIVEGGSQAFKYIDKLDRAPGPAPDESFYCGRTPVIAYDKFFVFQLKAKAILIERRTYWNWIGIDPKEETIVSLEHDEKTTQLRVHARKYGFKMSKTFRLPGWRLYKSFADVIVPNSKVALCYLVEWKRIKSTGTDPVGIYGKVKFFAIDLSNGKMKEIANVINEVPVEDVARTHGRATLVEGESFCLFSTGDSIYKLDLMKLQQ